MRTPTEAAQAISVSLPRYYLLERRALDGLVAGCEPRKRGYRKGPQQRIAELEKEVERLKRECDRHQALARASQRSVGLTLPAPSKKKSKKGTEPKRRRKRRPTVRALKAAKTLKAESSDQEEKTSPETRR